MSPENPRTIKETLKSDLPIVDSLQAEMDVIITKMYTWEQSNMSTQQSRAALELAADEWHNQESFKEYAHLCADYLTHAVRRYLWIAQGVCPDHAYARHALAEHVQIDKGYADLAMRMLYEHDIRKQVSGVIIDALEDAALEKVREAIQWAIAEQYQSRGMITQYLARFDTMVQSFADGYDIHHRREE